MHTLDVFLAVVHHVFVYEIRYAKDTSQDLGGLRVYDRRRILDRVEEHLRHEPTNETRNRKPLIGLVPPWDHEPPIWELRIDEYRIFYDVNEADGIVMVRAIRRKQVHERTEDIL